MAGVAGRATIFFGVKLLSKSIAGRIVLSHVRVSRFAEDVEYSEAHFHWPG